jgi:hypothetical protein
MMIHNQDNLGHPEHAIDQVICQPRAYGTLVGLEGRVQRESVLRIVNRNV